METYHILQYSIVGSGINYVAGDAVDTLKSITVNGLGGKYIEIVDAVLINANASPVNITVAFFGSTVPTGTFTDNSPVNLTYVADILRGSVTIASYINGTNAFIAHIPAGLTNRVFYIDSDTFSILNIAQGSGTINNMQIRITYKIIQ